MNSSFSLQDIIIGAELQSITEINFVPTLNFQPKSKKKIHMNNS